MTRRAHLAAWMMLCLGSFVLWPLWLSSHPPEKSHAADEAVHALRLLGPRLSPWLVTALAGVVDAPMRASAARPGATARTAMADPGAAPDGRPGRGRPSAEMSVGRRADHGVDGMATPRGAAIASVPAFVAEKIARYAEALNRQWQRCVWRAAVMLSWSLLLVPLWGAALVDGLSCRAVKVASMGYQNPAAFAIASHALILTAMLPWVVLMLPFSVTPWFMPAWSVLAMWPLRTAIAHMQPVFTR